MKTLIPGHIFNKPNDNISTPTADSVIPIPQPNIVVPRTLTAWGQYVSGHTPTPEQFPGNAPSGILRVLARRVNPTHPNHDLRPLRYRIRRGWERLWNTTRITYRGR